jgi:peptide/nickel transport system substrate-binding protein
MRAGVEESRTMDYSSIDRTRRSSTEQQVDVVDAFVNGRITRRQFINRAAVLGISLSSISAIIAACGGGTASPSQSSAAGGSAPASAGGGASASAGGSSAAPQTGGTIRVAAQRPKVLDPVLMVDLASYGLAAQCFEFLCTLNKQATDIAPGLAEKWTPNNDNTVWTFNLRKGVKWQDGSDFTADDVVETMKRLVAAANSGLKGVIDDKSTVATDPNTVTFNLLSANGNFPYLVSVFNAQSLITPKGYATGTTLDKQPNGTGPWKLTQYDISSGATFVRNEAWWGDKTPLDGSQYVFFDKTAEMVTAYQGGQIDAIVQFDVLTGAGLFSDPNFTTVETPTTNHRQIWMHCDSGQFADKKVRQAVALTFDRDAMIQQLFKGKALLANDHVIAPFYPYFDSSVAQRKRDVAMAKQLLSDAGKSSLTATLQYGNLNEIPDLAVLIKSQAAEAGINITPAGQDNGQFYDAQWCNTSKPTTPPCAGNAEFGIVDYGHRATPDVFLNSAFKTGGIWNSSHYSSSDFDAAFKEFQSAVGVDAQKAACAKIEKIMNDDVPAGIPYFYNYLSGNSKKFTGVYTCALGQMFLESASQVA